MISDEEDDFVSPEKLPIYQKGEEIFNPPCIGPLDKDPDDNIPFLGFDGDPEE